MSLPAYLYVVTTVLLSLLVAASLSWAEFVALNAGQLGGLGLFVALAVLSNAIGFEFNVSGKNTVRSSIAFIPLLAAAVVFPPAAAYLAGAITELLSALQRSDKKIWRESINAAQIALALALAAVVFSKLSNVGVAPEPSIRRNLWFFLGFAGLVVTYFGTNLLVVTGFFAIKQRESVYDILRRAIRPGGGNLLYDILASPVALVAAILYQDLHFWGVLIVVLPLMLIRYSYLSQVQLQEANRDLLRVLIKAIETRDPYTSGHSVRVSTLARKIADALDSSTKLAEQIETAGLLHDIGKIESLYSEIIGKKSGLTAEERAVIKTHATKGAELLRNLTSFDAAVVDGVKHHHERFDGTGYPDGLAGEQIPIAARIIMLCDAVDAMLSHRPYRPALPISEIMSELVKCSGTQFDPRIVQVVLETEVLSDAYTLVQGHSVIETKSRQTVQTA